MTDQVHVQDTLFRLTGVGVVQIDMKTERFVRVNQTFCEMVGYSEAELRRMTYQELTHPDDRERDAESFAGLQRGEHEGGTSLTRVLYKDGTVVWLELHVTAIREGSEAFNIAVVNNVTERKHAGDALRASEEKYHTLFDSMDEGYAVVEVLADERGAWNDLIFLEVNPAFVKQTAMPNPVGHKATEILATPNPRWAQVYGQVAETGEPVRFEEEESTLGRVFDLYAFRLGSEGSRQVAVLFTDITKRKETEAALQDLNETLEQRVGERTEALEHSEQRFLQAFYANPIPACMTTLGRETFVDVNDAYLTLTGYSRDEVVGKTSHELSMWSSPEDQQMLRVVQRDGRGFNNVELKVRTKEGNVRDILISAAVIQLDGRHGYLRMFYDITERKRTEKHLVSAIQDVMNDTSWFSQRVMEQLTNVRLGEQSLTQVIDLSKREREVLERLSRGANNEAIAADLGIATQTVRNYISAIYDKLGVHSRGEAIVWARERGIS